MNYDHKIIITKTEYEGHSLELLIYLDEKNHPVEIHGNSAEKTSLIGDVYVARVAKVMPQMNAAFLQAGELVFFYPINHIESAIFTKKNGKGDGLCQGDELLVQVVRDAIKTKEICVTTNLSFSREYVILTTGDKKIGISQKIVGEKRKELKNALSEWNHSDFGIVIRTSAQGADLSTIENEIHSLVAIASKTIENGMHKVSGTLIKKAEHSFLSHIRRLVKEEPSLEIVSDDILWVERLKEMLPDNIAVRQYTDFSYPIEQLYSIQNMLKKALDKKVYLPSGGYLLIEPTETLTVIDVNSGKNIKRKSRESYFDEINREAAVEIARQIRLRNISGMIIIDFINMDTDESVEQLMRRMRSYTKEDYVKVSVLDYTKLGLVEVTREKKYPSLYEYFQ